MPNAVTFNIEGQAQTFEVQNPSLVACFGLDPNWRELQYAQGGSSVALSLRFSFDPSGGHGLINPYDTNLSDLTLEINSTTWDGKAQIVRPVGNIPLHPALRDLEHLTLDPAICENSTLWLPSMPNRAEISAITFGALAQSTLQTQVSAKSTYAHVIHDTATDSYTNDLKEMGFELNARAVCAGITVEVRGREFGSTDAAFNEAEAKSCFASLYPIETYTAQVKSLNAAEGDVAVTFTPKD